MVRKRSLCAWRVWHGIRCWSFSVVLGWVGFGMNGAEREVGG